MTLEEIEKQIQEKENELKELKQRRLFMVPSHKIRIFPTTTVKNLFAKYGYSKFGRRPDYDDEELKKEAIRRVTNNRTESFDDVTYDEYKKLKDAYLNVAIEKLKEFEDEKERKEKEELEKKRAYEEKYKDLIEIDKKIQEIYEKLYYDFDLNRYETTLLDTKYDALKTKKKDLMDRMQVKEVGFPAHYEPV